jgi:TolA-binding protein
MTKFKIQNKSEIQSPKQYLFRLGFCALCLFSALCFVLCHSTFAQDAKEEEALFVAKKAFDDGFYGVSQGLLERYLAQYPRSARQAEVNLLLGQCFFHQNKYLEALAKFETLLGQSQAKDIKDAVLYWMAEVHFRGNSFSKATDLYKAVIEQFPDSSYVPASTYSLAWCLFQENRFEEALNTFKTVEEKYPQESSFQDVPQKILECLYNLKDYAALKERTKLYLKKYPKESRRLAYFSFYRAEADYYLDNFQEAIDAYAEAVKGSEDAKFRSLSQLGIGWCYLKLKKYKEAEDAFLGLNSADLDKRSQDVMLTGKAILMAETNRVNEAKDLYGQVLKISSDAPILGSAYLGKADALYNLAEYQEAVSVYKEGLSRFAAGAVAQDIVDKMHYGLSWAYLKQGEFKEAIGEFQKIVKESDEKTVKVSALCQIGDAYQDSGDYAKAEEAYSSLLKDYPDSVYGDYVQYQLGMTLLKASNYEGAILSFLALKRNFLQSKLLDDASYALGLAYFQGQDYNSSKGVFENFEREFKESPLKPQALYLLGTSLYNLEKFPEAIEAFKNIIRTYGTDADMVQKAEFEIADCYDQLGDEKEAMARFNALRSKYPDSTLTPEVMWWLGEYYYKHNQLETSRRYFSSLIRDFPRSPLVADSYYAIGTSFEEESKHEEAIVNFKKVIESGKIDLDGLAAIAIADIYVKQNKGESAIRAYEQVIQEHPHLSHLIFPKIADLYYQAADYGRALDFYRRSLDAVPVREMGEIQFKIADTLQARGLADEAVEEYLKTTYLYTQDKDLTVKAFLRVAQIYEDKENFKEAFAIYQRIVSGGTEEAKYAQERMEWIKGHVR